MFHQPFYVKSMKMNSLLMFFKIESDQFTKISVKQYTSHGKQKRILCAWLVGCTCLIVIYCHKLAEVFEAF